jgi:hypothetical protein
MYKKKGTNFCGLLMLDEARDTIIKALSIMALPSIETIYIDNKRSLAMRALFNIAHGLGIYIYIYIYYVFFFLFM